jgi:hypothetical protein
VAAVLEFTGTAAIAIGQDLRTVYQVFGENTGGSETEMGLAVGISSPGFIKFLAWINVTGVGAVTIDGVNVLGMISAAVPVGVAHTVVLTFSATTGNYSLYVDNLAPVTIGGVGPIPVLQTPGGGHTAFVSNGVQNGAMTLSDAEAWCVALTNAEIAQVISQLKSLGGL